MTYEGLVRATAHECGFPYTTTREILDAMVNITADALKVGDEVRLPSLCLFKPVIKPDRTMVVAGKETLIPSHMIVKIKPSEPLKEYVNGKRDMLR